MKSLVIIPARFASSRFPGKMLAMLGDKPVLQHVWERAKQARLATKVVIATDHKMIEEAAMDWGAEVVLTDPNHPSGTNRCAEVAQLLIEEAYRYVVNLQGDEPFINPSHIDKLIQQLSSNEDFSIATLCCSIDSQAEVEDPNLVKVVHARGSAQYFSRSVIPFLRDKKTISQKAGSYFQHIGIYAFESSALIEIARLKISPWAEMEKLEQLTWLENGYKIGISVVQDKSIGIDTPEDLERAQKLLMNN